MAKSLFLVASLLILFPLLLAAEEPRKAEGSNLKIGDEKKNIGRFNPIENINDPYIQSLGKFVVDEYNKQANTHLKFQKVSDGKYRANVQGSNYNLMLTAIEGISRYTLGGFVFVGIDKKPKLVDLFVILSN